MNNAQANLNSIRQPAPNIQDLKNVSADINLLGFLLGYIDLNRVQIKNIILNTNFTKNKRYSCFDYFSLKKNKTDQKFKLRKLNVFADNLNFNLYDENIKKSFYIKTQKIKFILNDENKPFKINAKGVISSSDFKISNFIVSGSTLYIPGKPSGVIFILHLLFIVNYYKIYYN